MWTRRALRIGGWSLHNGVGQGRRSMYVDVHRNSGGVLFGVGTVMIDYVGRLDI